MFSEDTGENALSLVPDANLDQTLDALRVRYGDATAHWVARQLEYSYER